jgi:hypothetical protein
LTQLGYVTTLDKLGYNIHQNIKAKDSANIFTHNIDGITLEKEFVGIPHQCNYKLDQAFDKKEILSYLL